MSAEQLSAFVTSCLQLLLVSWSYLRRYSLTIDVFPVPAVPTSIMNLPFRTSLFIMYDILTVSLVLTANWLNGVSPGPTPMGIGWYPGTWNEGTRWLNEGWSSQRDEDLFTPFYVHNVVYEHGVAVLEADVSSSCFVIDIHKLCL